MNVLSEGLRERAAELMARYPHPRSALILVLHAAQDEVGQISDEVVQEVADLFGLTAADVAGVVTFYTMFKREHPGRFLISVCTQSACAFAGGDETAEALRELIGPEHTATQDGAMSWEEVECLAYCSAAPAAQVNYRDVPRLTPERAGTLCAALREGSDLDAVLERMRAGQPEVQGA